MLLKRRNCKLCGKPALQNRTICYTHWREKQKALRMASVARQVARRRKKKEKLTNSYRYLHKQAWKAFSKVIRQGGMIEHGIGNELKDVYCVTCFTCGKIMKPKEAEAGHYFHGRLDFDPRNVHAQCVRCNRFLHGNLAVYATKLVEAGIDLIQLRKDAETKKYSCQELREIIAKYSSIETCLKRA